MANHKNNQQHALKQELIELRYKLDYIEASRWLRLVTALRKIVVNPLNAHKNMRELVGSLKKVHVPPPDYSSLSTDIVGPPYIHSNQPLLKYPNIKVACLGGLDRFNGIAHAFDIRDGGWSSLVSLGIDLVVVDSKTYLSSIDSRSLLESFIELGAPMVYITHSESDLKLDVARQSTLVLSANQLEGAHNDRPFVDLHKYNPINKKPAMPRNFLYIGDNPPDDRLQRLELDRLIDNTSNYRNSGGVLIESTELCKTHAARQAILELGSCGVPIAICGNKQEALAYFDNHMPLVIYEFGQESKIIDQLQDPLINERHSISLRRHIHLNWSKLNYFEWILSQTGLPVRKPDMISIIASTMRPENLSTLVDNINRQNYSSKEAILVLHGDNFESKEVKKALNKLDCRYQVIRQDSSTIFGDNLNLALDNSSGDYVTKMDDDDYYGPNHLFDLYAAHLYSRAEIVGKWANWVHLKNKDLTVGWMINKQESFCHHLPGATIFARKDTLQKIRFGRVRKSIDSEMFRRLEKRGGRLYSTHRYNFVRVRHGSHTYKTEDEEFLAYSEGKRIEGLDANKLCV